METARPSTILKLVLMPCARDIAGLEPVAQRHYELKKSEKVSEENRKLFNDILSGQDERIEDSLRMLSQILFEHYGKKSIILIDEYDVPLDKAFQNG